MNIEYDLYIIISFGKNTIERNGYGLFDRDGIQHYVPEDFSIGDNATGIDSYESAANYVTRFLLCGTRVDPAQYHAIWKGVYHLLTTRINQVIPISVFRDMISLVIEKGKDCIHLG